MFRINFKNGQNLALTKGSYGTGDSEYAPAANPTSKVILRKTNGKDPGYFEFQGRLGKLSIYGRSTPSLMLVREQAAVWFIETHSDRFGNEISYSYTRNGNGEPLLSAIPLWAGSKKKAYRTLP